MRILLIGGSAPSWTRSWTCTALGAWLRGRGIRALPFKVWSRSANPLMTLDGGEVSRSVAAACEACGFQPRAAINPFLEKAQEAGEGRLLLRGEPWDGGLGDALAVEDALERSLEELGSACDVLLVDASASPSSSAPAWVARCEAGIRDRAWLNIILERTGRSGAETDAHSSVSTAHLALGFQPAQACGVLALSRGQEDSWEDEKPAFPRYVGTGDKVAWVRLPSSAVLNEWQPWLDDTGVSVGWIQKPEEVAEARAIVLPGCLDTLADLRWLKASGFADAVLAAQRRGVPVAGICGGYQLLGERLTDLDGVDGSKGDDAGLGLLPVKTLFENPKIERRTLSHRDGRIWPTYEIHRGRTAPTSLCEHPNELVETGGRLVPEGASQGNVWGTYQHGWFEAPEARLMLARAARLADYKPSTSTWQEAHAERFRQMASLLEERLDLSLLERGLVAQDLDGTARDGASSEPL